MSGFDPDDARRSPDAADVSLDLAETGSGPPLVLLHGGWPSTRLGSSDPIVRTLAERFHVIAPTHPGFGPEPAPDWMTTVDDLAYLYLDLLDELDLGDVALVGCSFGGWVAAALAVMSTQRLSRLVLVDPVGIKVSGRETRDIVDIFSLTDTEIARHLFSDPNRWPPDYQSMDDDDLLLYARAREATARHGWSPYLHDPKLKRRLQRIDIPTLLLWGESDQMVDAAYPAGFAAAIPNATAKTVPDAGHFPHLENPAALAQMITDFATNHDLTAAS